LTWSRGVLLYAVGIFMAVEPSPHSAMFRSSRRPPVIFMPAALWAARLTLAACASALVVGCAMPRGPATGAQAGTHGLQQATEHTAIPAFSNAQAGDLLPNGWSEWILHPTKKRTRYRVVVDADRSVVRAQADQSASGLIIPLNVDLKATPVIEWQWRAEGVITDADNAVSATEDAPLRIVLAFEGDKSTLPMRERLFAERVKLISGRDLPYASLMYIWGNQRPAESLIANPHTSRIQKLVVDTGRSKLRQWRKHRRNIVADYRRAFGTDPGRLIAVAIMTDTDNTASKTSAYYGDIRLVPADPREAGN